MPQVARADHSAALDFALDALHAWPSGATVDVHNRLCAYSLLDVCCAEV